MAEPTTYAYGGPQPGYQPPGWQPGGQPGCQPAAQPAGYPPGAPAPSGTPAPPAGGTTAPSSPDAILDALADAVQQADAQADVSKQALQSARNDLTELQREYAELDKAVAAYATARPTLQSQLQDRKTYIDQKKDLILRAVDGRQKDVDKGWDAFAELVKQKDQQRADRGQALAQANAEYATKKDARDRLKGEFEALVKRSDVLRGVLTKLGEIERMIETAEANNDTDAMYVLLREHNAQADWFATYLKDVDGFRSELVAAWCKLATAKDDLRAADQARVKAQHEYDQIKDEPDRLKADRVAQVLKILTAASATQTAPAQQPVAA